MKTIIIAASLGWSAGAMVMWAWFAACGSIRDRDEWERAKRRRRRGY